MPKPFPKTETEIVMSVDRDAGVLDLRVFATQHKRAEVVGTASLRMADVPEAVPAAHRRIAGRGPTH
jgi:hypothetical protein